MSRLFIYYNERKLNNDVSQDSGAELRDGAKVINQFGVCPEKEWPYVIGKFTVEPTMQCYTDALPNTIHSYYALDGSTPAVTLTNLKTCLANGQCFVFGFNVYDSFESDAVANTGVMPMPDLQQESIQGGHAVMAIGYNDAEQRFLVRNSWGRQWGLPNPKYRGYFTMPYAFISDPNMASDFWTVVKDV
jgi:C1A family cysteine protease